MTALEALILARKGDRRKSVLVIRDAFPALGGAHQARLPEEAPQALLPARLPGAGPHLGEGQRPARPPGLRHHPPGERLRPPGPELGRRARPDAAHAGHGPRAGGQDGPVLLPRAALRPGLQPPAGHHLLPPGLQHVRRQPGARARRLQRRPVPHQAALARVGLGASSTASSRAGAGGAEDLRQAHPGALGQLPAALSARPATQSGARDAARPAPAAEGASRSGASIASRQPSRWLLAVLAAWVRGPRAPPPHDGPIVLITFDGLRADVVGGLGGPPGLTPHLDALIRDSDWAGRAISPSSWTAPAMASLLTGLRPWQHQVLHPGQAGPVALARSPCRRCSQAAGYRTGGFASGHWLEAALRLRPGLRRATGTRPGLGARARRLAGLSRRARARLGPPARAGAAVRPARLLLAGRAWGAPERLPAPPRQGPDRAPSSTPRCACRPAGGGALWAMYRLNVAWADERLGRLLAALRASGQWDRTLLVVTADHGEEFGERGQILEGGNLGRQLLEVPLASSSRPASGAGSRSRPAPPGGDRAALGDPGRGGRGRGAAGGGAQPVPRARRRSSPSSTCATAPTGSPGSRGTASSSGSRASRRRRRTTGPGAFLRPRRLPPQLSPEPAAAVSPPRAAPLAAPAPLAGRRRRRGASSAPRRPAGPRWTARVAAPGEPAGRRPAARRRSGPDRPAELAAALGGVPARRAGSGRRGQRLDTERPARRCYTAQPPRQGSPGSIAQR